MKKYSDKEKRRLSKSAPKRGLVEYDDPLQGLSKEQRLDVARRIGAEARLQYEALTTTLDTALKPLEPIHAACYAGYLLAFMGDKPRGADQFYFGQHEAETLQALLLRHPLVYYDGIVGTPDQIEIALDIARNLSQTRIHLSLDEIPESEADIARHEAMDAMRLHTQVVRGDFYPEQLPRLFRPILTRIDPKFLASFGVQASIIFDLLMRLLLRVEQRLNDHIQLVAAFFGQKTLEAMVAAYKASFPSVVVDLAEVRSLVGQGPEAVQRLKMLLMAHSDLQISAIFHISEANVAEDLAVLGGTVNLKSVASLLDHLSLGFGDLDTRKIDHILLDNPVWTQPFIKADDGWYWPFPTTFTSYCSDIFRGLVEKQTDLKKSFEDARAAVLEVATADAFGKALPGASIWRGVRWRDAATGKGFENDVVILLAGWLILVEAKSGQVTDSARRGSFDRLKRHVKELILDPAEQSKRFEDHLRGNPGPLQFETRNTDICVLDSSQIVGVIRLNLTYENIGNINARAGDMIEAGLILAGTDLPPTLNLGWLDIVLNLLGSPSAIMHYLRRRKLFEASADYMADELDLVAFYLDNGFNIGETETDGTRLMIYGYSNHLDVALTESRDRQIGPLPTAVTPYWGRLIEELEERRPDGWLSLAIALRGVAKDNQGKIERIVRRASRAAGKKGPMLMSMSYGPTLRREGVIVLVRGGCYDLAKLKADLQEAYRHLLERGVLKPLFLMFEAPIGIRLHGACLANDEATLVATCFR